MGFIVDGTPPTLTILSPSGDDAQISQSTFVTIMWSGRDDGSGIDYYEIRINGGQWRDVGRSTEYTFSGLFDGEHTVDIRAVDKAGNQQVERATFEVDPGSPSELFTMQLILLVMMVIAVIGLLTLVMFWKYHKEQRKFHKAEMLKESKKKPLKKKPLKRKDD